MGKQYTYEEIASDYELWADYVDPNATMTEKEFSELSVEEKVEMQKEMFGQDESDDNE